jgi:hypothetical protein
LEQAIQQEILDKESRQEQERQYKLKEMYLKEAELEEDKIRMLRERAEIERNHEQQRLLIIREDAILEAGELDRLKDRKKEEAMREARIVEMLKAKKHELEQKLLETVMPPRTKGEPKAGEGNEKEMDWFKKQKIFEAEIERLEVEKLIEKNKNDQILKAVRATETTERPWTGRVSQDEPLVGMLGGQESFLLKKNNFEMLEASHDRTPGSFMENAPEMKIIEYKGFEQDNLDRKSANTQRDLSINEISMNSAKSSHKRTPLSSAKGHKDRKTIATRNMTKKNSTSSLFEGLKSTLGGDAQRPDSKNESTKIPTKQISTKQVSANNRPTLGTREELDPIDEARGNTEGQSKPQETSFMNRSRSTNQRNIDALCDDTVINPITQPNTFRKDVGFQQSQLGLTANRDEGDGRYKHPAGVYAMQGKLTGEGGGKDAGGKEEEEVPVLKKSGRLLFGDGHARGQVMDDKIDFHMIKKIMHEYEGNKDGLGAKN